MKFLKKKKKDEEPIIRANGKIIARSFSGLNLNDFLYHYDLPVDDQFWLISHEGRIFINSEKGGYDALLTLFEIFIPYPKCELMQYRKRVQNRFPRIKTIDGWLGVQADMNDEDRTASLALFLIPVELERREIERKYYYK